MYVYVTIPCMNVTYTMHVCVCDYTMHVCVCDYTMHVCVCTCVCSLTPVLNRVGMSL